MNYYNEIDLSARRWLRELVKGGLIPDGYIDNRPIQGVRADELRGFNQCHFFAGIGGWPYALRLAGWPDDKPVWTGSCPCQPFSSSGRQMGFADSRHLFPTWRCLIARCTPPVVFGGQVASPLGREWLARIRLEMATLGYATRGADLCSAGVAAPNLRQRLYWMAYPASEGRGWRPRQPLRETTTVSQRLCHAGTVGDSDDAGCEGRGLRPDQDARQWPPGSPGLVGLKCTDGKTRRINPAIFPLAPRLPGDVALIRGAGNAINPWVAAKFITDCAEN